MVAYMPLALFTCLMLAGCKNPGISNAAQRDLKAEESILVYNLTYKQYLEFLNTPSVDCLESNATKYSYSVDAQNKKIFKKRLDNKRLIESADDGVFRISNTPIYSSLINFWSDKSQVQQYLETNNIYGAVDNVLFLSCYTVPCSIGLYINSEWYFVIIDEFDEDYQLDIHSNTYAYRLYTRSEILKKYQIVNADLFINGNKKTQVKMHYNYAEIPITYTLEQLGADIQRNDCTVIIEYNKRNAKIHTTSKLIEFESGKRYGEEPPGGFSCFFVQGTETYLDTSLAADVLLEFGAEIYWSRENGAVYVTT